MFLYEDLNIIFKQAGQIWLKKPEDKDYDVLHWTSPPYKAFATGEYVCDDLGDGTKLKLDGSKRYLTLANGDTIIDDFLENMRTFNFINGTTKIIHSEFTKY